MRGLHLTASPFFPIDLNLPIARSLTLQFILQEFLALCELAWNYKTENIQFDKLCFYCQSLLKASHKSNNEILVVLEEMRHAHFMANANSLSIDLQPRLQQFFKSLSPYLEEMRFDENVIAYLIEHRQRFNHYLGTCSIEKLLKSFFPAGHTEMQAVLFEGYIRRGFLSFFAQMEPLVNALEW